MIPPPPLSLGEASRTLGTGDNLSGVWSNVDGGDCLVVSFKGGKRGELGSVSLVELDGIVPSDSESLAVGAERMVQNWLVKEEVDFWLRHVEEVLLCI